jgi:hypothetical protein
MFDSSFKNQVILLVLLKATDKTKKGVKQRRKLRRQTLTGTSAWKFFPVGGKYFSHFSEARLEAKKPCRKSTWKIRAKYF